MFVRITKATAKKLFAQNQPIYLCPNKMWPDGPFSMACLILGKEYLEKAEGYRNHPDLWKGTVEATAWGLMYANSGFSTSMTARWGATLITTSSNSPRYKPRRK